MDRHTTVREAQRLIIDRLVHCETALSELYAAYGNAFPETKDFWGKLSDDEQSHAGNLNSMHALLDKGDLFYNLGRFDTRFMDASIAGAKTALNAVNRRPVSLLQAMTVALSMETSLLDGHFYEVVTSDAPEFVLMIGKHWEAEKRHMELLQQHIVKQQLDQRLQTSPK